MVRLALSNLQTSQNALKEMGKWKKGSILQYFRHALIYHVFETFVLSIIRQILLYRARNYNASLKLR